MSITTLQEYVSATEQALFNNPPRNSPAYADDPKRMWRYYMRNFGAGLAYYDETKIHGVVSGLYSGWFMRLEFNSHRPDINAKEFIGWIKSAEREMRAHLTKPAPDAWESAHLNLLSTLEVDSDLGNVPTPTKRR